MEAGRMRKVDLYGKVKVKNELDQTSYNDGILFSFGAEIIPQTASMQRTAVETMLTHVTHKIVCRYNKAIMDAYQNEETKNDLHIKYDGHRFDIQYILDPYFKHKSLEIFVKEVIG